MPVVSQDYQRIRAGTVVNILQREGKIARVRVISIGWNQFEVYTIPIRLLSASSYKNHVLGV
jgi:hypothetical protein